MHRGEYGDQQVGGDALAGRNPGSDFNERKVASISVIHVLRTVSIPRSLVRSTQAPALSCRLWLKRTAVALAPAFSTVIS